MTAVQTRSSPRLRLKQITCELGEIVDLSLTGMRIRGEPLQLHALHECLLTGFGSTVGPVIARVVWCEPLDDRTHEAGLTYLGLSRSQSHALTALAMLGREQRCFAGA